VSAQLQEHRTGGREFQILGDVSEKLGAPNGVRANGTGGLRERARVRKHKREYKYVGCE